MLQPAIVKTFGDLSEGEALTLVYDREPHSLLLQLEESFPESFAWSQRNLGRGWEVTLRKIASAPTCDPIIRFLERCPAFATSSDATRRHLARVATSRLVAKNKPVALQGVPWPFLGVVRSGKIYAIVSSSEGREQILYEAYPFDVFGETMVFDRGDSVARFAALSEPAEVLLIPRDEVLKAMLADDAFQAELAAISGHRVRSLVELLCSHVSKPVMARIALLLARHSGEQGSNVPAGGNGAALTLSQIAAAAGTVKEVVARTLSKLEDGGAIQRRRGQIFVIDANKLARFA